MTTPMSPAVALMKMLKSYQRFQLMAAIYTVPLAGALYLLLGRSGPRDEVALGAIGLGHLLGLYLVWSWYLQARVRAMASCARPSSISAPATSRTGASWAITVTSGP